MVLEPGGEALVKDEGFSMRGPAEPAESTPRAAPIEPAELDCAMRRGPPCARGAMRRLRSGIAGGTAAFSAAGVPPTSMSGRSAPVRVGMRGIDDD